MSRSELACLQRPRHRQPPEIYSRLALTGAQNATTTSSALPGLACTITLVAAGDTSFTSTPHGLIRYGASPWDIGEAPGRCSDQSRSASSAKGLQMLFYPAALPLSRQTLDYTAGSSAATVGRSARPGASSTPGSRPSSSWPTCAKAKCLPSWPPGSASAPPPPGDMSPRRWPAGMRAGPQGCAQALAQGRGPLGYGWPQAAALGVRKADAGAWTARSRAAALLRVRQRARELGRRARSGKARVGALGSENGRSGASPGRGGACAVGVMTAKELARNVSVLL
jgi:hypothetical protein